MKSTLVESHGPKEEGGGGSKETWLQKDIANNNLELRLGISLTTNKELTPAATMTSCEPKAAAGPNPSTTRLTTSPVDGFVLNGFGPSPGQYYGTRRTTWFGADPNSGGAAGFIHPWSLAARQQKAVFEQAHHRPETSLSNTPPAVPRFSHPIVGWPPVRASRRNLGASSPAKPEMDRDNGKDAKKAKTSGGVDGDEKKGSANHQDQAQARPMMPPAATSTMFVKVNMEGFAVGRKINLKAYDSYESLSRALQKMFTNFLSTNYASNPAQEEQEEDHNPDYVLLYEDHEGDRMLVGDVPWELFITSVKRLYIAHSPKATKSDEEKVKDEQSRAEQPAT